MNYYKTLPERHWRQSRGYVVNFEKLFKHFYIIIAVSLFLTLNTFYGNNNTENI